MGYFTGDKQLLRFKQNGDAVEISDFREEARGDVSSIRLSAQAGDTDGGRSLPPRKAASGEHYNLLISELSE